MVNEANNIPDQTPCAKCKEPNFRHDGTHTFVPVLSPQNTICVSVLRSGYYCLHKPSNHFENSKGRTACGGTETKKCSCGYMLKGIEYLGKAYDIVGNYLRDIPKK